MPGFQNPQEAMQQEISPPRVEMIMAAHIGREAVRLFAQPDRMRNYAYVERFHVRCRREDKKHWTCRSRT
ncbi:hypothetical protein CYR23_17700 [Chimaeribacter arupi]|nr:hypothetical protein CYR23_17700 [Chimaeribacter arupi]